MWKRGHPRARCSGRGTRPAARAPRRRARRRGRRRSRSCGRRPGTSRSRSQPTQASVPSSTGMPSWTQCGTSANFESSFEAKRRARCSWPAASTLTPKRLARCDLGERARAVVEADEHEHGVEAQARDRVGGHALGAVRRVDGDDGHAGGEVPHDGAEAIGLDGSHLTISVPYMPSSSWLESAQKKRYSPLRTLNVVLSRVAGEQARDLGDDGVLALDPERVGEPAAVGERRRAGGPAGRGSSAVW